MAIEWGSWSTAGNNNIRCGIDLSRSGTTITVKYYVEMQYTASDNQTLTRSGALTGTTNYTYSQSGGQRLIETRTKSGSEGSTYTFGAKISDVYTGGSPSVSASISIPVSAKVPGKPGKPSASAYVSGGTSRIELTLASAPASNGASISEYQWDLSTKDFTAGDSSSGRTYTFIADVPLGGSTTGRVRAVNSVGQGPWSDYSTSVTVPNKPGKCAKPTLSNVASTSLKINLGSAPASVGAPITYYEWQVEGRSAVVGTTTRSQTITGLTANTAYRARVRAYNVIGVGDWSDWSASSTTTPAAPAAPGKPSVARVSDTSQTITWPRNATSAAPYTTQYVERNRWSGAWEGWQRIATVAGTATTYSDGGTIGNRGYQYRIVAANAGGSSTSAASDSCRTTPAAPSALAAESDGDTTITVTGVDNDRTSPTRVFRWQQNPGGGSWVDVAGTTASPTRTFTGVNPAVTNAYRARAEVASGTSNGTTLTSGWSGSSNTVQLQVPPDPPTVTLPSGTRDRSQPVAVGIKHRPVDTTKQTAYELRYRIGGGGWTTLSGTTATSREVPALGVSGLLEVQARTKGAHPTWSDWSATVGVSLAAVPTVTITSPEDQGTWTSATLPVAWGYYAADVSLQAGWEAQLAQLGGDVAPITAAGTGTGATTTLKGVIDRQWYELRVRVRSASGLWSDWATSWIWIEFTVPYEAETVASWHRADASTSLEFTMDKTSSHWTGARNDSESVLVRDGVPLTNRWRNPSLAGPFLPVGATFSTVWAAVGDRSIYVPPTGDNQPAAKTTSLIGYKAARIGMTPVDRMIATPGATWAHRGGSGNWPEMTRHAYTQSLAHGYGCLEISMGRTLDGVWFGLHDQTIDRVSGVSGGVDPAGMTWSQLTTAYQVVVGASGAPQPFMSWAELLVGLPPNTVLVVDPKYQSAHLAEFLAMVREEWGVERTIFKFYGVGVGSVAMANQAAAAGFEYRWGYFYQTDYESGLMARDQGAWSLLGMDYTASPEAWDAVKGYGKPVVGHIAPNLAAYNLALSRGADMVQVADVAGVPAVTTWL